MSGFSKWSIQKPVYWIQHNSFSMVGITANQTNLLHFTLIYRNREQKREIPLAPITYVLTPSQMICHIIEYLHINYWILSLYYLNVVWITVHVFFIHWKGGSSCKWNAYFLAIVCHYLLLNHDISILLYTSSKNASFINSVCLDQWCRSFTHHKAWCRFCKFCHQGDTARVRS